VKQSDQTTCLALVAHDQKYPYPRQKSPTTGERYESRQMFVKKFVNARTGRFSARNIRDVIHVIRVDRLWVQSVETLRYESLVADLGMPLAVSVVFRSNSRVCPLSVSNHPANTSHEGGLDKSYVHPQASVSVTVGSRPLPTSHTRSSVTTWLRGVVPHIMWSPDSEVPIRSVPTVYP
jgi:hypothetical protein